MSHCSSVSSVGASSSSWFLYMKTKGQLEEAMIGMGFSYTSIFRPGYLNRGTTERFGEKIMCKQQSFSRQHATLTKCVFLPCKLLSMVVLHAHSVVHQRIGCVNAG